MKVLEFLKSAEYGCATTSELMALSREDRENGTSHLADLKRYAREEMANRGIEVSE